jgi:transposase-like protein
MDPKTKSKRKKHPEQFELEAVRVLETRGERTVADVTASLDVSESLLHSWKKKYASAAAQLRKERGGEIPVGQREGSGSLWLRKRAHQGRMNG